MAVEARLAEIDRVIGRLEAASLTTARALQEISKHWSAVYEALRREEDQDLGQQLHSEASKSRSPKR